MYCPNNTVTTAGPAAPGYAAGSRPSSSWACWTQSAHKASPVSSPRDTPQAPSHMRAASVTWWSHLRCSTSSRLSQHMTGWHPLSLALCGAVTSWWRAKGAAAAAARVITLEWSSHCRRCGSLVSTAPRPLALPPKSHAGCNTHGILASRYIVNRFLTAVHRMIQSIQRFK
jgi:hypothetical protein